jgi:hypothetical protein
MKPLKSMNVYVNLLLVFSIVLLSSTSLWSAQEKQPDGSVKILPTHNAKINLNGQVLGVYRDHTPVLIKNVPAGVNKLYVKSTITDELKVYVFEFDKDNPSLSYKATFAPPKDDVNNKARRRTGVIVALAASEILGDSTTGKQDRRKVIGGLAVANELIPGVRHDRTYSKKYGNTIEVKTQVDVDINVDGTGSKAYKVNEAKRFHHLEAGWHKLFIRNIPTQELRTFKIEFPTNGTRTVTIRPEFAPPMGESVNAKSRRRTGILGALLVNEVAGDKGTGREDRRKVGAAAALINELIPTKRDRVRKIVTLDLNNLGELPETLEDYDRLFKNADR